MRTQGHSRQKLNPPSSVRVSLGVDEPPDGALNYSIPQGIESREGSNYRTVGATLVAPPEDSRG
jgi:hypothetical protein